MISIMRINVNTGPLKGFNKKDKPLSRIMRDKDAERGRISNTTCGNGETTNYRLLICYNHIRGQH